MEIKEVENLLSVSRSNIRFYEKEGLINPKRRNNNYRNYSDEDIALLKKILVLRKLGFSVEEISLMQKGELSLSDAIVENETRLEQEIEQLNGALKVTKQLSTNVTTFEHLDEDYYWNIINKAETSGEKFINICKDYLLFELDMMDNMWKYVFFHNFKKSRKSHSVPIACGILLLICLGRGLANALVWQGSFWEGFLYPFILFLIGSIILLPIYILSKKAPKTAGVICTILLILMICFFALLALLILYGLAVAIINLF